MYKLKVLICDDMEHVRNAHENLVVRCGGQVFHPTIELVESPEQAIATAKEAQDSGTPFDVALLDIDYSHLRDEPERDGYFAAREIHRISPDVVIAMVSAYSTEQNLLIAEQCPWVENFLRRDLFSLPELSEICTRALVRRLHTQGKLLPAKEVICTRAPVMKDFLRRVDRIGPNHNVVLYGETGTGKELSAKRINANARVAMAQADRPLVIINCGGLTDTLQKSELFGYVKGAFTGALQDTPGLLEKAESGDVFLDELQNAPRSLQESLMRVIEEEAFTPVGGRKPKRLNVRFITALNRSPSETKRSGSLMPDLLARLQQNYLVIPPLRDRSQDIPVLVEHFKKLYGSVDKNFSSDAIAFLESAAWPENIRGLKNVVDQAISQSKLPLITAETLGRLPLVQDMISESPTASGVAPDGRSISNPESTSVLASAVDHLVELWLTSGEPLTEPMKNFEKKVLQHLWRQDGSPRRIGRRTKMAESTVRKKLSDYQIS